MINLSAEQLLAITPHIEYLPHIQAGMDRFGISENGLRVAAYLAQVAEESGGFSVFTENLNYSAQGLMRVWPKRFPNVAAATPYAHNPEKLANFVYANRLGNHDEASGDGWRYRGRGPIQITGFANYSVLYKELNIPVLSNPDILANPQYGFLSSAWYWDKRKLNPIADRGDFKLITRLINGGLTNYNQRLAYYNKLKRVLGV